MSSREIEDLTSMTAFMEELMDGLRAHLKEVASDYLCLVDCEHGGMCGLLKNHDGQHDAGNDCRWGGEE